MPHRGRIFGDFISEREPTGSEREFFKSNPHVGGRATEDHQITINPFSSLSSEELDAVRVNERSRVFMRQNERFPKFDVTSEQLSSDVFKNYGTMDDIRQSIVGRILSGDPSVGRATAEQLDFSSRLEEEMRQRQSLLELIRPYRE